MSLLKENFLKGLELVGKLGSFASLPAIITTTFDIIWLGSLEDELIQVEVKDNDGELGWLYSNQSIVAFERNTILYGIRREDLKSFAEKELTKKVFIQDGEESRHGVMKRVDKSIHAYLSIESLRPLITTL